MYLCEGLAKVAMTLERVFDGVTRPTEVMKTVCSSRKKRKDEMLGLGRVSSCEESMEDDGDDEDR